jgi:nucleosome binding factor SPN SPT16 subunit
MIDKARESVLLPIYGQLVPFHIHTVKNVMQSQVPTSSSPRSLVHSRAY